MRISVKSIYIILVSVSIALCGLTSSGQSRLRMGHKKFKAVPVVGSNVKPAIPFLRAPTYCVVGSANLYPCFYAIVSGVTYQVAYSKTKARKFQVEEVRTVDPHFKTPEGLSVGKVIAIKSREDLILTPNLAFDGRSGGDWLSVLGQIPGPVIVASAGGKDTWMGFDELHLAGQPVQLRIAGFVLRKQEQATAAGGSF